MNCQQFSSSSGQLEEIHHNMFATINWLLSISQYRKTTSSIYLYRTGGRNCCKGQCYIKRYCTATMTVGFPAWHWCTVQSNSVEETALVTSNYACVKYCVQNKHGPQCQTLEGRTVSTDFHIYNCLRAKIHTRDRPAMTCLKQSRHKLVVVHAMLKG